MPDFTGISPGQTRGLGLGWTVSPFHILFAFLTSEKSVKRGFFGLAMHRNEVGAPVRKAEHPAPFLDPFDFRHSTLGLLSFLVQILMVGSGSLLYQNRTGIVSNTGKLSYVIYFNDRP